MTVARVVLCLIAIGLCTSTAPAMAQWTNKPSTLSTVYDCPFSNNICGMGNFYNTQAYASPGGTGQVSPPVAFDSFRAVNSDDGNGQWGWDNFPWSSTGRVRELFFGVVWRTNADFQGMFVNSNKMLAVGADAHNNFLIWSGGQWQPRVITFILQQTDGSNNCHLATYQSPGCSNPADGPGTGTLYANHFNPAIPAGDNWHKIEVYQKSSTTTTSRDGVIRWWIDGVLAGDFANVNLAPQGLHRLQINHAWDGGACNPTYRDCSKAWHHYWDHMIIAVSGGGGGSSPPPPPPLPPNKPTNLRVQ